MTLVFLAILIISIIIIISLRFEIEIKVDEKINPKMKIKIYTLKILKIGQIKINKRKLAKIGKNKKLKNININKILKNIKNNKPKIDLFKIIEIKKIKFILEIGTEEIFWVIYAIPIISVILSIIYSKTNNKDESMYKITPLYNKNTINLRLDCIISIDLVHIINIMWKIIRKRDGKNERTSNRRSYAHCNE